MEVEWLSAVVVVLVVAVTFWRTGASAVATVFVVGLCIVAVVATALVWGLLITSDS